jgi:hypothetical protein
VLAPGGAAKRGRRGFSLSSIERCAGSSTSKPAKLASNAGNGATSKLGKLARNAWKAAEKLA